MIYKNNYEITPAKKLKITFNKFFQPVVASKDENLPDVNIGSICYNFNTSDGSLTNGYGLADFALASGANTYQIKTGNDEVSGVWAVRWLTNSSSEPQDYVFYMTSDGSMYYVELSSPDFAYEMQNSFEGVPSVTKIMQNSAEAFAFTSSEGLVVLNQLAETLYSSVPNVMDVCYHYNKLFAITEETRNALVYSSQLDVTQWTSSNTYRIDFTDNRGRLIRILSFNDELYIFREYGITKVSPYGISSNFSIDHIFESTSCIYTDTISNFGDKIIFMTREGMYSFNGSSVKKIDFDVLNLVEKNSNSCLCAESFDGKYFLACKINFPGSETIGCESATFVNNAVVIFDFDTNQVEILRGVDIKAFARLSTTAFHDLLAIFRGSNKHRIGRFVAGGKVFGSNLQAVWSSGKSDFGFTGRLKHVSEVKLISKANSSVVIESEIESKEYQVTGNTKVQRIKTNVKGKNICIKFKSSSSNQKISKPEISVTIF